MQIGSVDLKEFTAFLIVCASLILPLLVFSVHSADLVTRTAFQR
jgi:hypothetical protein